MAREEARFSATTLQVTSSPDIETVRVAPGDQLFALEQLMIDGYQPERWGRRSITGYKGVPEKFEFEIIWDDATQQNYREDTTPFKGAGHAVGMGRRIAEQRARLRLTLDELRRLSGISHSFLSQVERELKDVSAGKLGKIAWALGVTTDFLIYG